MLRTKLVRLANHLCCQCTSADQGYRCSDLRPEIMFDSRYRHLGHRSRFVNVINRYNADQYIHDGSYGDKSERCRHIDHISYLHGHSFRDFDFSDTIKFHDGDHVHIRGPIYWWCGTSWTRASCSWCSHGSVFGDVLSNAYPIVFCCTILAFLDKGWLGARSLIV